MTSLGRRNGYSGYSRGCLRDGDDEEGYRAGKVVLCSRLRGLPHANPSGGSTLARRKTRPASLPYNDGRPMSALRAHRHVCAGPNFTSAGLLNNRVLLQKICRSPPLLANQSPLATNQSSRLCQRKNAATSTLSPDFSERQIAI